MHTKPVFIIFWYKIYNISMSEFIILPLTAVDQIIENKIWIVKKKHGSVLK